MTTTPDVREATLAARAKAERILAELKAAREASREQPRTVRVGFEDWTLYGPDDTLGGVLRRLELLEDFELPLVAAAIVEEQARRYAF